MNLQKLYDNHFCMGIELLFNKAGNLNRKVMVVLLPEIPYQALASVLKQLGEQSLEVTTDTIEAHPTVFTDLLFLAILDACGFDQENWSMDGNTAQHIGGEESIRIEHIEVGLGDQLPNPIHFYIATEQDGIRSRISVIAPIVVGDSPVRLGDPIIVEQVIEGYFLQLGHEAAHHTNENELKVAADGRNFAHINYEVKGIMRLCEHEELESYMHGWCFGVELLDKAITLPEAV